MEPTSQIKRQKLVTPVIHSATISQVKRNISKCVRFGADGVWLIGNMWGGVEIRNYFAEIRSVFPDLWIGINPLSVYPYDVLDDLGELANFLNGIWSDNAEIIENGSLTFQPHALAIKTAFEERGFKGEYFGGVAFKYQHPVESLEFVTKASIPFMDVVTTSGDGTGVAANISKIATMHHYLNGAKPLGIASGITPENVKNYLPYVDRFLVATGISSSYLELDEEKGSILVETVKRYSP